MTGVVGSHWLSHAFLEHYSCLVFSHVEGAGLDPRRVVNDAIHDRISMDAAAEAGVPVLFRILGAEHC